MKIKRAFDKWNQSDEGRASDAPLKDFCIHQWECFGKRKDVPKKLAVFVARCRDMTGCMRAPATLRSRTRGHTMRTRFSNRRRKHGTQGRPHDCPELRDALFQWFIDIRSSLAGRLWPRQVLTQARCLCDDVKASCIKRGLPIPKFPDLTHLSWITGWKRQFGVSFKHPDRRYKVNAAKVRSRCKTTWLNTFRVRFALTLLHGEKRKERGLRAGPYMHGVDQKGIHYNETESKKQPTLALQGSHVVKLKTNHAQSRKRMSLNTMVQDDPYSQPPIELTFKVKTDRTLKGLKIPVGVKMSLNYTESGSYNEVAFLRYLERWLPAWSEAREADCDWRILFLDDYTVHKTEAVKDLCFKHGFIIIMFGGGCTGVLQWNDTGLHQRLSQLIQELGSPAGNRRRAGRRHRSRPALSMGDSFYARARWTGWRRRGRSA